VYFRHSEFFEVSLQFLEVGVVLAAHAELDVNQLLSEYSL
jgi:hypothetical protein